MYKLNEDKTAVGQDEVFKWPRNRDVSLLCFLAFVIHASVFCCSWFAIVLAIYGKINFISMDLEQSLFRQINNSSNNNFTIEYCNEWEDCLKY